MARPVIASLTAGMLVFIAVMAFEQSRDTARLEQEVEIVRMRLNAEQLHTITAINRRRQWVMLHIAGIQGYGTKPNDPRTEY